MTEKSQCLNVHIIADNLIKRYSDIYAYDVIVKDCRVMLIDEDDCQYHCNDFEDEIQHLSTIALRTSRQCAYTHRRSGKGREHATIGVDTL